MRILISLASTLAIAPSLALASVDAPPEPPTPLPARTDRIQGPFATGDAYCAFRERELGDDDGDIAQRPAPCTVREVDDAPRVRAGQAIRAYRIVEIQGELHVVVETGAGWYGRGLVAASSGDSMRVDAVRLEDLVGDRDDELAIDTHTSHDPCGCDDLWHAVSATFACTVLDGALRCTDGITTADHMHLADVWSWSSTLAIGRDGRARRTITESERVSRRELRALGRPFRVTFHR